MFQEPLAPDKSPQPSIESLRAITLTNICRCLWQLPPLLYLTYKYHALGILARWRGKSIAERDAIVRTYAQVVLKHMRQRVTVVGEQTLQGLDYFAVASNHASNLDFAVLLGHFPTGLRFIAKRELRYIPGVGAHLVLHGVMIDRKDRRQALGAIERAVDDHDKTPILIFPEGTRSDIGHPKPFKKGGLSTLLKKGVPIVPVTIHGTFANMPRRAIRYVSQQPITMTIGQAIRPDRYPSIDAAMQAIQESIHKTYEKDEVKK